MAEQELTKLDDIAELSKSDISSKTSEELREMILLAENIMINHLGEVNHDKLWDLREKAADRLFMVKEELRDRMMTANQQTVEDESERIDRLEKKAEGMQTAIDKLKEHGHDGEVSTFQVTYPGRRD